MSLKSLEKKIFLLLSLIFLFFLCIFLLSDECSGINFIEGLIYVVLFLSLLLFLLSLLISNFTDTNRRYAIFSFLIVGPIFLLSMVFLNQVEIKKMSFSGIVSKKYISKNHAQRGLEIDSEKFEPIPVKLWNGVNEGDYVEKKSCSVIGFINKKEIRIFDE